VITSNTTVVRGSGGFYRGILPKTTVVSRWITRKFYIFFIYCLYLFIFTRWLHQNTR